jgi:hypothetical protein
MLRIVNCNISVASHTKVWYSDLAILNITAVESPARKRWGVCVILLPNVVNAADRTHPEHWIGRHCRGDGSTG